MRVALDLEHEGRRYVGADVWAMGLRPGQAPWAVLSSVSYSWRTRSGAWSQTTRLVGTREEVPEAVRRAALEAARQGYLERAQGALDAAETLRLVLVGDESPADPVESSP